MLKSGCVLFSLLFVAPFASAEIFKCVGKGERLCIRIFPANRSRSPGCRRMSPPRRNHPSRRQSRVSG